jgi:hypothetical protein
MSDLWYPDALVAVFADAGEFTGGPFKGLLHTTEGTSYAGAAKVYADNGVAPHFTPSFEGNVFRVRQHIPINRAAKALRNLSGGVQTNRDSVIQIEVVAFSDITKAEQYHGIRVDRLPAPYVAGLRKLMRWIEANAGVKRRCTVAFKPYPSSYGANNGVRMSAAVWDAYDGWCGHEHAPENLHGDPGNIDIAALLAGADEEDGMAAERIIDPKDGNLYIGGMAAMRPVSSLAEVQKLVNEGWANVQGANDPVPGHAFDMEPADFARATVKY